MSSIPVFVVRLILGMVFGILLTRIFRPEWSLFHGVALGAGLIVAAYLMEMVRQRIQKNNHQEDPRGPDHIGHRRSHRPWKDQPYPGVDGH